MRNAVALQIPLNGEDPVVETVEDDGDAFDSDDCSIYAVAEGDDDYITMIEDSLLRCDCGNDIFVLNRCSQCGAVAPWASKLGCGLG